MKRLAIVASHVIQYQDPFFRRLAAHPDVDLTVLYCSRAGAEEYRDEDMRTTLKWDLELLTGYRYRFLTNIASNPNRGYTRLINPGVIPAIVNGRYDGVLFMMGWGTITSLLGIVACRMTQTPFFLYGDSSFPPPVVTMRDRVRARLLRALFQITPGFMVSGKLNADFYRHYGADERRFFLLPWAVDNDRFAAASGMTQEERRALRRRHAIPEESTVFLFSAKLVARKDPMTLLRAYEAMANRSRAAVVFLGDGPLREGLERFVSDRRLSDGVRFLGFVNQSDIPGHYAMSDVLVLPSLYEPRGAVINEAMASGLPVVVTDRCGSIGDIVQEGKNALIYPAGDPARLAGILDRLVTDQRLRESLARRSREIIGEWTYDRGVAGVIAALNENERV